MSSRGFIDFFTVNLLNFEYCINFPIKTFLVFNGFLASMLIPLLLFDTFYKPLLGYGPAQKSKKSVSENNDFVEK